MPTISTIIPAYNAAKYLAGAVESALAQKGVQNEIIVIDDGSSDETWTVLQKYRDQVRLVRQENLGIAKTRNRGAALAHGAWLAFLDADDHWVPNKLSRQLALVAADVGLIYSDRINIDDSGHIHRIQGVGVKLHDGDVLEPLVLNNFISTSTVLIERNWFHRLGGFDPQLEVCEDWDLWLRFAGAGGRVKACRDPLTEYRLHASSVSQNLMRMRDGRLRAVRRALQTQRGRQLGRSVARRALANAWSCSAWYAAPTMPWTAAKWYLSAACHWPFNMAPYKGMLKCLLWTR